MADPDDIPWLDDVEMVAWLHLVGIFIRLPYELDAQLRCDAGVSHFEYQILAGLSTAEGRSRRMSDIADFTAASLSRLSHAARRLEEQGWLTRSADPDDGRATVATLTAAGHAKLVATAPGHVRTVRRLVFDPLTRQQVQQLGRIAAAIDTPLQRRG